MNIKNLITNLYKNTQKNLSKKASTTINNIIDKAFDKFIYVAAKKVKSKKIDLTKLFNEYDSTYLDEIIGIEKETSQAKFEIPSWSDVKYDKLKNEMPISKDEFMKFTDLSKINCESDPKPIAQNPNPIDSIEKIDWKEISDLLSKYNKKFDKEYFLDQLKKLNKLSYDHGGGTKYGIPFSSEKKDDYAAVILEEIVKESKAVDMFEALLKETEKDSDFDIKVNTDDFEEKDYGKNYSDFNYHQGQRYGIPLVYKREDLKKEVAEKKESVRDDGMRISTDCTIGFANSCIGCQSDYHQCLKCEQYPEGYHQDFSGSSPHTVPHKHLSLGYQASPGYQR